jgi:hypothetical protein
MADTCSTCQPSRRSRPTWCISTSSRAARSWDAICDINTSPGLKVGLATCGCTTRNAPAAASESPTECACAYAKNCFSVRAPSLFDKGASKNDDCAIRRVISSRRQFRMNFGAQPIGVPEQVLPEFFGLFPHPTRVREPRPQIRISAPQFLCDCRNIRTNYKLRNIRRHTISVEELRIRTTAKFGTTPQIARRT